MEERVVWHVIYTKSRQEKIVAERLGSAGYEIYLPLVKILSQWSDRKKMVEKPVFNSYVFVKDSEDNQKIKEYNGVVGFLKYNNKLAVVHQHEINTLKSILKHGYDISEVDNSVDLQVGSRVMIIGGPLKGSIGELFSSSDEEWFVIHFENLGNSIKVKIPRKLLKKIE